MKPPFDCLKKKISETRTTSRRLLLFSALSLLLSTLAYGEVGNKDILSADERDWLAKNKTHLVLAVETAYAPFVFIDAKGQPTGLAHDYMRLMESKIGVRFDQRRFPNLNEIFQAVHSGDVKIVNAITNTPERARFLSMTEPYISVPNVIIVRKERSGHLDEGDLQGSKVSLVKSYAITEHMTSRGSHFMPDLVSDDLSALLNVSFGRSDAAVIDLATATYLISEKGISNLRVAGEISYDVHLAIGTPLTEPVLHSILQKGLNSITDAERLEIRNRWISVAKPQSIFMELQFWLVLGVLLAIAFVVLAVILAWNRTLRQQVALRKKAEQALQTIINNEPECIKIVDAQGRLTQMNPAGLAMIEADSLEQVLNDPILNVIAPEYCAEFDLMHQRVIGGESAQMEFEVIGLKGGRRWLETHAVPMKIDDRTAHLAVTRDITERKQSEKILRERDRRFQTLFDRANDGISIISPKGELVSFNDAFARMHGYTIQEMQGLNLRDLDTPVSAPQMPERMRRIMAGESLTFEVENYRKDGSVFPLEVSASLVEINGEPFIQSFSRDISERKQAETRLAESELRYRLLIEMANEGIVVAQDGMLKFINPALLALSGYSKEEVANLPFLDFIHADDQELVQSNFMKRIKGEPAAQRYQLRLLIKTGGVLWVEMSSVKIDWEGRPATLNVVSDITERKKHEQQLEHIAHYDALTNLPNRVLLADRLYQGMMQAQRRGQKLSVAYLDLDGFKAVNDSHGHEVGDQLLMVVATNMKQALREGDTLARIGGDEFVAVLIDLTDIESSVPMLNRLLTAAAQPVRIGELNLQVSASLGVTYYPQAEEVDADQLLRQADQAMYQAKLAGKNRYHLFDTEHDNSIRGRHESLEAIRRALIDREFVLYYQPKVNMRSGAVVGAEALIRWQHPEKGLLPPGNFLPVIEDHPLAVEIGEWVIDTALTQMELWHQAGLDIPVSVNVGALQLQRAGFVTHLREMFAAHPNVKPSCLEIEVLETSALEDIAHVSQVMEACREIGVSFALDDFGTGYSSLTYLKRLPVSLLKIDQSFVRDMLDDPDDLAILEGVLGLAIAFRREVIAEGVETLECGAMLLQLGCDHAQGYGIAHPMPAHEMPAWAASWKPDATWLDKAPVSRDDLPILFAGVEHRAWITALETFLKGEREIPPSMDAHHCRFGQWLDTDGLSRHKTQPAFKTITSLHQQIHTLSATLLALHAQGKFNEIPTLIGELHALRDELLAQLKSLVSENPLSPV